MTEGQPPSTEALIRRALDVVEGARPMPLSSSVMITKEDVVDLLKDALERMPEEVVEARRLLRERDDVLARAHADGEAIVRDAASRAEQFVRRTEIVRAAEERARRIVADAQTDARRLHMDVEEFCDQRLASFESALDRVRAAVEDGRSRLSEGRPAPPAPVPSDVAGHRDEAPADAPTGPFFDQDQP